MAGQKYGEIRYNIDFEVNNQSLQSLKKSLQDIMNMSTTQYQLISPNASKEFAKAGLELKHIKENASQVQQILTKTFNEKLNTSNITQLRNEINKIGFDNIYESWSKLGINGTKAFNQLTASILSGNTQLKQTHKILDSIATSFKNTIKWGISSAVWNNLTGSIQKAWTYTKNLDSALNDIRIVSGQSAAQMEKFAIQANKAAQALGSSTLDYAKASLIYFQQGLGTEEANARAEVTVKMANVLGASAKEVSDYMTAIWNNFDNGSKSLEYFADVITALGASTAASSEEIATGLEKFAAVANTVGLSYEYATAALATVVAQTRQSADTVGTAFKTIFARIQDLELGKTLDDGTTLGKYAEALQKVGINIKDQQNQLKDMNTILDEMGKKWTTLTKDQQVALAQNVAGTRQYTQLIALLDNWDDVTKNIKTAGNATGTLQKQQDIYLESTEAHLTKLSTATERLMSSFVDKKGINSLIDGLTNLVTFMSNFIESIGGGKNALMVLGSVGMQVFDTQIARSIGVTLNNLKASREATQSFAKDLETLKMVQNSKAAKKDAGVRAQIEATEGLIPLRDIMTTEQVDESNAIIHEIGEVAHLKQEWEETGKQVAHYLELLNSDNKDFGVNPETGEKGYLTDVDAKNSQEQLALVEHLLLEIGDTYKDINDNIASMSVKTQEDLSANIDLYTQDFQEKADLIKGLLDEVKKDSGKFFNAQKFEDLSNRAKNLTNKGSWLKDYDKTQGLDIRVTPNTKQKLKEFGNILDSILKEFAAKSEKVNDYIDKEFNSSISHSDELKNKATQLNNKLELLKNTYQQINEIKGFVNMVAGIGQVASAISSLTNLTNILKNDSLSTSEKILQIITNVSMSIPLLVNGFQTFIKSGKDIINILQKQTFLTLQKTAAEGKEASAILAKVAAGEIEAKTEEEIIALKATAKAGQEASIALDGVEAASNLGLSATFKTLGASIWIALKPLLPFIAIGGALVGIIALVVKAYNADADAAKKAAEAQKHATEAAEKAKQTYEELNEGFKKYDEGVEAFKKLKVGAEGYQEALDAANQSAMDLIKSNNELAKYATRDGNGLITFGDEKQQSEILNRYKAAAFQSEAAADVARVEANRASLKSDRTNFLRESGMEDLNTRAIYNNSKRYSRGRGSRYTGLYNQEQEPLKLFTDQQLQEVINVINRNNGNFIREDLEKLSDITSEQIDVLEKHQEALLTLAEKTDNLNATNRLLNTEALKNSLQSKEWFNKRSGAEQNAIAAVYGDQFGQVNMNALRKRAEDKWDHDAWLGGGNEDEVHTEYAKRMGYTLVSDNSGDTATYLNNKTGEEITVEDDTQREYLKNYDIQQWMADYDTDYLEGVVRTLDKINNSEIKKLGSKYGTDFQTAIYNAIASDDRKINLTDLFTDLSPDEIQELQTTMTPEKWKDTLGLSDEEIKEIFNFSDAELEESGKTAGELFAEKFNQALSEYKWSAKDAVQKALLSDDEYKEFGLTKEDVAGYSEYLMDIANGAEDAADGVNDLSNEMEYNAKSAVTVAKSVMRMNSGVEKLADGQKDWLNILKKSSIESKEYYDAVDKLRDAIGDLLDLSKDTEKYLDGDFFKKNAELIKKASEGSASAIDKLRKEASKSILISIATDNKLDNTVINNLKTELDNLQKMAEPIVIGTELNIDDLEAGEEKFIEACNKIIEDSKMTAEQATAFFESIGFEPTFETTEQTVTSKKPITKTVTEDSTEIVKHGDQSVVLPATRTWSWIDGYIPVDETIQVPAMSSDGNAPTIKTITKKGTGISNNYSSKNKGGGSPGKSSKSGGGSDSGKKHVNDEFDRYHQINTQITKVDNSLQKLQSQQKKLTGGNLIENLTKQWQLLNTQVDNYNKKLDIAYEEQDELYKKLISKGFKFNSDGTIANYMGALKAAEDKYNAKIDQYNSLSSANKKKWEKNETLDKAKEEYDNIKKWADRYDELISDFIPDLKQNIQDSLDKQIELNVQKFNLKLTVTLDMNQATRDWNEWKKRIIDGIDEDDIYGNANARLQDFFTYYSENGRGDIQAQTEQVKSILTELKEMDENGWSDIYHDDRAQALEELKEKYTALMESMTDAAQIEKDLYQAVLDEMDAVREKFDEQVESYEFLRDIINHDLKVVQMVYGEDAYGAMSKFYDKQQQTYNEQLDFHKQEMDLWYARMQAAEEGSKEWEKARDNWKDAVENYNQILEEGLENAKNKFQNALNDIFQNLNNQVTSGKGLDFVNEEWELVNKNANKYLDTINATYGIRELEKKYLDSINKTDNVKAQQKLKKVMDEQLTNLRQKDKLTQYDLDRANKLYEIELARMALEDARQNKSQMRLRRDSQGNYSYQYVANQDELQKAQDQVDQLTNSLYNFDKERYNAVLGEVYTIWSEYQQKMAEASLINDPELRAEKQRLIQEQYNQLMMQTEEDYQVSKYNLEESFFKDWTNLNDMSLEDFQNLSDNEKDIIMTEMVPTWKNGISEMAEVFYGENGFARVTQDSWKAIKDAEKEYDDDLKTLEITAGQTYDAIKNGLDENIPKSEELIKNNNDLITVYDEELTRVENVYRAVGDLITQYREAEQAAKDAAEAAYKYENKEYNNQIDEIGDQGNSEPEPEKQPEPTPIPQPEPTPPPVDNTPKTGTGNGIPEVGDDVTVKKSATKFSSKSGGVKMWYKVPGNKFYIKAVSGSEIKIGDPHGPNYTDKGITGWVNKKDLEGYNTGGYTGSWDNSGRLAMLHQKELILNQTDTKNMLNAVSVMRGLTYSLGSSILAKLANASATNYSNTGEGGGILEQDVHIEATFPNVRNAIEIEQALNNLVNVASQRIMEKR